jgi:hypothetical protein
MRTASLVAAAGLLAASSAAMAGSIQIDLTRGAPDLDRWNYPFNATPGVRATATSFAAFGVDFLDDHDAQFLLGFLTSQSSPDGTGVIPSGLGESRYIVTSAQVSVTIATGGVFDYDPTFDTLGTYLDPMDPDFIADADAGRPIMLFGTGYRNGFGIAPPFMPFVEVSPYSFGDPAMERVRNAYASDYENGMPRDISNSVLDRLEIDPFAIGEISSGGSELSPGASVPAEATVTFDLDVSDPDVQSFLARSLDAGNLQLSITSLQAATGGPGGGGGVNYPVYFTKEDPLAPAFGQAPQLTLDVTVLPENPADLDGDGVVGASDLAILIGQWGQTGTSADFAGDGVGADDLALLIGAWG